MKVGLKESWAPNNWFFWTVVLEKTLESLLDCKEIQPVHPKGTQSWIFIGRTDAEAETPIPWPPHAKSWLIGKDPDAGKGWRQEEKGDSRGWDDWMATLTQWTWVWVNTGSWWTGRPGVLQSLGLQRVEHYWETELNWIFLFCVFRESKNKSQSSTLLEIVKWLLSIIFVLRSVSQFYHFCITVTLSLKMDSESFAWAILGCDIISPLARRQ